MPTVQVPAANGSAGGRGEDSFWDTGTTGSAPEELLLRQDGQKPKPGTSAPVTETTPLLTPGAASLKPFFSNWLGPACGALLPWEQGQALAWVEYLQVG